MYPKTIVSCLTAILTKKQHWNCIDWRVCVCVDNTNVSEWDRNCVRVVNFLIWLNTLAVTLSKTNLAINSSSLFTELHFKRREMLFEACKRSCMTDIVCFCGFLKRSHLGSEINAHVLYILCTNVYLLFCLFTWLSPCVNFSFLNFVGLSVKMRWSSLLG